jgi:hypothetical protein
MALTFTELYDGIGAQSSVDGGIVFANGAVRRFLVPVADPAGAMAYSGLATVNASPGQFHPQLQNLVCTDVQTESPAGGGQDASGYFVRAIYKPSNYAASQQQQTDRKDITFTAYEGDVGSRVALIPILAKQTVQTPTLTGLVTSTSYVNKSFNLQVPQISINIPVRVATLSMAEVRSVADQVGKVHTFPDNGKYLFKGMTFRRDQIRSVSLVYHWVTEAAVVIPATMFSDALYGPAIFPVTNLTAFKKYDIREPVAGASPPFDAPYILTVPLYDGAEGNALMGWSAFPGDPVGRND